MSDRPIPQPLTGYPDEAAWLADLDHAQCRQDRAGRCYDIHCVYCGVCLASGWAPCHCRDRAALAAPADTEGGPRC